MCKRKSPQKNKASMGCVKETPQIKKGKKAITGCVRETPSIKTEASMGCVKETPKIKMKPAWDV